MKTGGGRDLGVWHATTTMLEGLSRFCGEALDRADHFCDACAAAVARFGCLAGIGDQGALYSGG